MSRNSFPRTSSGRYLQCPSSGRVHLNDRCFVLYAFDYEKEDEGDSSKPEYARGIRPKQVPPHLHLWHEFANHGDCLCALAFVSVAEVIFAIAAIDKFVLMPMQEFARMVFVALERV